MLFRFVALLVVVACTTVASGEDVFLNKPQEAATSARYHVKWLTDFTKFPVPFQRQCEAGDENKYVWRRVSDDLLIRQNQRFDSYMVANGGQKTTLLVNQIHLDHPEELAIYEPIMVAPPTAEQADHHRDLFTFAYVKSHSILVNKTQDLVNITCVADFMVPNGFDEDINDGFLAKMERNAIFKMTMNSLNSVKKENNASRPPVTQPTTSTTTTIGPVPMIQRIEETLEREKDENYVKSQLKTLLDDLHKNHHPQKLNRDPTFSQTWTHIQRSNPRANNEQANKPKLPMPHIENAQFTNEIFQAQKKVQDKLMMLQNGVGPAPAPVKQITPNILLNPFARMPGMAIPMMAPPMAPPMPIAVPIGMHGMQMPMFAFMNKRKRFARQADQDSIPEEASVPEVTSQIITKDEQQAMREPIQQIRLKYGPITLYRPLRQAEIITCNLKLINHDDMKIDHQSTIFATVRKDTADKKDKSNKTKTNPQYEAEDEAKWAKELNDITNSLKKKIQQNLPTIPGLEAPKAVSQVVANEPETKNKLDTYEAALENQKADTTVEQAVNRMANSGLLSSDSDSVTSEKVSMRASAFKKAPSSGARSFSIDIALLLLPLLVYYLTAF